MALAASALLVVTLGEPWAAQSTLTPPLGTVSFGTHVVTLPNGNIVVTDPNFMGAGPGAVTGAVFLFRPDGSLVSVLRGSTGGDHVGFGGVVVLANGNYVVVSPFWNSPTATSVGAVTFGSATTGVSGEVSAANSLVGSTAFDQVGIDGVTALSTGNYVVRSPFWRNGGVQSAGAVTFGSGVTGIAGVVSPVNSLVGSSTGDQLGDLDVTVLSNGDYVVSAPYWNKGSVQNAGAATFGSGTMGVVGTISATNSLVGAADDDLVGARVAALPNGGYVVWSSLWDNGAIVNAGAVTFGPPSAGVRGTPTPTNSLVGGSANDGVGSPGVTILTNGNYVVRTRAWDNGAATDAGAATFGSGTSGVVGVVSPSNSLVGSRTEDWVGTLVTPLRNGNYVVGSPDWDSGLVVDAGAATFGSGTSGISGAVTENNSLVGSSSFDNVGTGPLDEFFRGGVLALTHGDYIVCTPTWDNAMLHNAGAATFASGTHGVAGTISSANSLLGARAEDAVCSNATALGNGNYVIVSPRWDDGTIENAGAVTFGSGQSIVGASISAVNSLVGGSAFDGIGGGGVTALPNGNYVVASPSWTRGALAAVGAFTFGTGSGGATGTVSAMNSLIGGHPNDWFGYTVQALPDGDYVVISPSWRNGDVTSAGAVTFGSGTSGVVGPISAANSLVGTLDGDKVGSAGVTGLGDGNYVVNSHLWADGTYIAVGAVTLGLGDGSTLGAVNPGNSVIGTYTQGAWATAHSYDPVRKQLAVANRFGNRVVLHRPGTATRIAIVSDTPDPSWAGQPVVFTATVTATPSAPADGQVRFMAGTGESCVDSSPTATSPTTADFSCSMVFSGVGAVDVRAEFIGSMQHAYSGSLPESHVTETDSDFVDGFESR